MFLDLCVILFKGGGRSALPPLMQTPLDADPFPWMQTPQANPPDADPPDADPSKQTPLRPH